MRRRWTGFGRRRAGGDTGGAVTVDEQWSVSELGEPVGGLGDEDGVDVDAGDLAVGEAVAQQRGVVAGADFQYPVSVLGV